MKINTRWIIAEDVDLLRGSSAWSKVKYFWRKGWIEIPVIMGSTILATIGTGMIAVTAYHVATHDRTPKYYKTPRIYRPDDPEVQKICHVSQFD